LGRAEASTRTHSGECKGGGGARERACVAGGAWREGGRGAPKENLRCGALYSLGRASSLPVTLPPLERGVAGSDVLGPAAPSAPPPAASPWFRRGLGLGLG